MQNFREEKGWRDILGGISYMAMMNYSTTTWRPWQSMQYSQRKMYGKNVRTGFRWCSFERNMEEKTSNAFFRIRNVVMPKPHSVGCRGAKKPFLFFIWATLWAKQKLLVSISRYGLFVAGILFKIKTEKQHGHVPKKTRSLSSLGRAKHTGVLTKAFSILCLKRNIKKE